MQIRNRESEIAKKNHEFAQVGYRLGTADYLTLLKAKNDLINSQLSKIQAEVNLKKIEIAVDEATGMVLGRFGAVVK